MKLAALNAILLLAFACGCLTGCGDSNPTKPPSTVAKHEHKPPHGGTPVVLGDEEYHVELVLDAPAGKLDAYVFDGELENFVRSTAPEFQVLAKLPSGGQTLVFKPIPNSATGETVGDTSLFETQADWLKKETNFDAVLKQITVRGKSYENVEFNFPKGNDKDEKPK